jgi:hypothetical protein
MPKHSKILVGGGRDGCLDPAPSQMLEILTVRLPGHFGAWSGSIDSPCDIETKYASC